MQKQNKTKKDKQNKATDETTVTPFLWFEVYFYYLYGPRIPTKQRRQKKKVKKKPVVIVIQKKTKQRGPWFQLWTENQDYL